MISMLLKLTQRNDMTSRIVVIDLFPLIRFGVVGLLKEAFEGIEIYEFSSWNHFKAAPAGEKPVLFILGIELDSFTVSSTIVRKISREFPDADIIVYDGNVRAPESAVAQYKRAGASAYVSKKESRQQLLYCIEMLLQNDPKALGRFGVAGVTQDQTTYLTDRFALNESEISIANYLSQGLGVYHAARMLGMTKSDFIQAKKQMFSKFDIKNISQLKALMQAPTSSL